MQTRPRRNLSPWFQALMNFATCMEGLPEGMEPHLDAVDRRFYSSMRAIWGPEEPICQSTNSPNFTTTSHASTASQL